MEELGEPLFRRPAGPPTPATVLILFLLATNRPAATGREQSEGGIAVREYRAGRGELRRLAAGRRGHGSVWEKAVRAAVEHEAH